MIHKLSNSHHNPISLIPHLRAFASESMGCFALSASVECFVLDAAANLRDEASSVVWKKVASGLSAPSCSGAACAFALDSSAWGRAVALTSRLTTGERYVSTHVVVPDGAGYLWQCAEGCLGAGVVRSATDATFASSVSLFDSLLAVGAPGAQTSKEYTGDGTVRLYRAAGTPDTSGYARYSAWEDALTLKGGAGFGAVVSLGAQFLLVQAPGNSTVPTAVHVYHVGVDGAAVTAVAVCSVRYSAMGRESLLGASLAQSTAEDGISTVAVLGAPGANKAFTLKLKGGAAPTCAFEDTFSPETDDLTIADRFG